LQTLITALYSAAVLFKTEDYSCKFDLLILYSCRAGKKDQH